MGNDISITATVSPTATLINSIVGNHCEIGNNTLFCYSQISDYSYVSRNSNIFSSKIGKFTSISWNVSMNPAKHDYHRFTQHPFLFANKFGFLQDREPFYKQYGEVLVGNDVWIGCNAVIMDGVTIGDGAIIGSGARISKDVQPYSIVVGNNKHLKNRFDDDVISALLDLKWWDASIDRIKSNINLISERPTVELIQKLKALLFS